MRLYKVLPFIIALVVLIGASEAYSADLCSQVFSSAVASQGLEKTMVGDWDLRDVRFLDSQTLLNNRDYLLWQRFPHVPSAIRQIDPSHQTAMTLTALREQYLSSQALARFETMSDVEIKNHMESINQSLANLPKPVKGNDAVLSRPFLSRNLNFLFQAFRHKYLSQLVHRFSELKQGDAYTRADVVKAVNAYYDTSGISAKGGYSFDVVLDSMQIFSQKMQQEGINPSEPFLLFGSFPGGRANLKVSDADIHVPKNLEEKLAKIAPDVWSQMTERIDQSAKDPTPQWIQKFQKICPGCGIGAKRKEFTLRSYKPADDYRAADKNLKATNEEVFGFMDPIMVRLHKDQIEIIVIDSVAYDRPSQQVSLFLPLNGNSAKYTTPVSDVSRKGESSLSAWSQKNHLADQFKLSTLEFRDSPKTLPLHIRHERQRANLQVESIHFMQASAGAVSSDLKYSVLETASQLKSGAVSIQSLPPIGVWQDASGKVWTSDHRRLAAARLAQIDEIPVYWLNESEITQNSSKYSTVDLGRTLLLELPNRDALVVKAGQPLVNTKYTQQELKDLFVLQGVTEQSNIIPTLSHFSFAGVGRKSQSLLQDAAVDSKNEGSHTKAIRLGGSVEATLEISQIGFSKSQVEFSVRELQQISGANQVIPAIGVWKDSSGRVWTTDNQTLALALLKGQDGKVPVQWLQPSAEMVSHSLTDGESIQLSIKDRDLFLVIGRQAKWMPVQEQGPAFGTAIIPNEYRHDFFSKKLEGHTGALISVGTFRVYHEATKANLSSIYMMDYDPAIGAFNRLDNELIRIAKDRRDYLSLLFLGRHIRSEEVALGEQQFMQNIEQQFSNRMVGNLLESGVVLSATDWSLLRQVNFEKSLASLLKDEANPWGQVSELHKYEFNGTKDSTIFYSDKVFSKVQRDVRSGKYTPANGDISSATTISDISRRLQTKGEKLAALDVSNALWHVARYSEGRMDKLQQFVDNLKHLPWQNDGFVLFTTKGGFGDKAPESVAQDHWIYFAAPVREFIQQYEKQLSQSKDPVEFIGSFEASVPPDWIQRD